MRITVLTCKYDFYTETISKEDILEMLREYNGNDEYKNDGSSFVVAVPTHKEAFKSEIPFTSFCKLRGLENHIYSLGRLLDDLI